MRRAAQDHLRSLGHRIGDMLLDLLDRGLVDQWTLRNPLLQARADPECLGLFCQLRRKSIINTILNQDAIGANAELPHIAVCAYHCTYGSDVEVSIDKHK